MANKMRFGKGYELTVVGTLVGEGFDVYLPTVDDQGIDAIIRLPLEAASFRYHEVQVKGAKRWSGIRCKTEALFPNSILILYSASERKLLWFLFQDVQKHFPIDAAVHGPTWGNVFLTSAKARELADAGHGDIARLKAALGVS